MSGRRWIFTLLAAVPISATGCQVDGGATKMWNPFARADKTDVMDDGQLPKFVRRETEGAEEKSTQIEAPIAEGRAKALLVEGQRAMQENRITEARQAYQEVLQLIPDDPTAHHGLAMVADLTEQWKDAESHYRQALRSRPRDANLLCDIGYSYLLQNRYSEASSYLSQAVQLNPNHENAQTNLALLEMRQGNREAARQRLIQRYGDSADVTQILAALESQTASGTPASLAATAPPVPKNASFEEIREIANRERIAAEQRRAAGNVAADHAPGIRPASADIHSIVPGQYSSVDLQGGGRRTNRFVGSIVNPAAAETQSIGIYPSGNAGSENHASNTGASMPYTVPPKFGGASGMASPTNPSTGNPNPNLQYSTHPDQASFSNQQTGPTNNFAQSTVNTTLTPGGVIAVRPSGSFQPPTQDVSYGQPFGFGQPPIESAGDRMNGNAAASVGATSYGNTGQNNAHVQLDGLNAGPGSLFPIGQGSGRQDATLRMENVSPPGSNGVINGAMYGQPVSTLPAQEWMMQQQQQIQQMNSPPPPQNGQNYFDQGDHSPEYSGNNPRGSQHGNVATAGSTTAPRPEIPVQPVNPLATYENQLRQLDNQYNNTLQRLDSNAPATAPRARY